MAGLRVVSYGGGVQSLALLVLAAQRRIGFPVFPFANTGDDSEDPATLDYVRTVAMPYAAEHGIELHVLHRFRRTSKGYEHEYTEYDHHRLAEALHPRRATVVLSGYSSDLYDLQLYRRWRRHTMPAATGQGSRWTTRTEVLWSNRPLETQAGLFDLDGGTAA